VFTPEKITVFAYLKFADDAAIWAFVVMAAEADHGHFASRAEMLGEVTSDFCWKVRLLDLARIDEMSYEESAETAAANLDDAAVLGLVDEDALVFAKELRNTDAIQRAAVEPSNGDRSWKVLRVLQYVAPQGVDACIRG